MIYVATFHGDIADKPPLCGFHLNELLLRVKDAYGYGNAQYYEGESAEDGWWEYTTPDPEDDKIEVWEFDPETGTGKIVWGFWGWHWPTDFTAAESEGLEQGTMPGNDKPLYTLAME